jgi:RNA polymerase primary sigma factor
MSGKEGEDTLAALVADGRPETRDEQLDAADTQGAALGALARLGTREASILRLRFGLDGEEPSTLKDIGKRLGLTRERIRQIEESALVELRNRLENANPTRQLRAIDSPCRSKGRSPRVAFENNQD